MPRPEQVGTDAGQGAPHGAQAALERLAAAVPPEQQQPAPQQMPEGVPVRISTAPAPTIDLQGPDLNAGLDPLLFGPSSRPNEPLTAGVPFGPGVSFVPRPEENDQTFKERVATELSASPSGHLPEVQAFVAAIRQGQ